MTPRTQALVFDLYGTLLRIGDQAISRGIPRALGVERRAWMELVRGPLLTRSFADRAAFVRFICERLAPAAGPEAEAVCLALVEQEMASIAPIEGVKAVLPFFKRRGLALGLLSNLSSLHKEPLSRFSLADHFAATALSCDLGQRKPEPAIYLGLAERLGAAPEATLVVGDSLKNDVEAPRRLGFRALRVGDPASGDGLPDVSSLGWMDLDAPGAPRPLVREGDPVRLGERTGVLRAIRPLADAEQGRYNLVARARLEHADGRAPSGEDVFVKRLLFPEGAHVEELAHRLHAAVGLPSCRAAVLDQAAEPILVVSKAEGVKFEGQVDPPLAYELGRHSAVAYLFANADLRPRNAFLAWTGGGPRVTMVDLEHCFFNIALDVAGLEDPRRPQAIDGLPPDEQARRMKKKVLTEKATHRARKSFFDTEGFETDLARAFRRGWVDQYRAVQADGPRILALVEERLYQEPYLIIGTQSYRRAMARMDVEDMGQRLAQDPEAIFEPCF